MSSSSASKTSDRSRLGGRRIARSTVDRGEERVVGAKSAAGAECARPSGGPSTSNPRSLAESKEGSNNGPSKSSRPYRHSAQRRGGRNFTRHARQIVCLHGARTARVEDSETKQMGHSSSSIRYSHAQSFFVRATKTTEAELMSNNLRSEYDIKKNKATHGHDVAILSTSTVDEYGRRVHESVP